MLPLILLLAAAATSATPSRVLLNQDLRHDAFTGVARLRLSLTCTAFLVQPSTDLTAPVYVLTNGHCPLGAAGNEVVTNARVTANAAATFHYFVDTPDRFRTFPVRAIPYATLKGLDLAIVELDATWQALAAAGIHPLRLAASAPAPGAPVSTVGAPIENVPPAEAFLRKSDCSVDARVQLAEGPWKFHDALRLACGGIYGGASGSPVLDRRTQEVVAIINTGTQGAVFTSGDFPCFQNSPCELTRPQGDMRREAAYALPLAGLSACFNNAGRFDLNQENCPLDPGREPVLRGAPLANVRPGAEWNVTVTGANFSQYRYKTGPEFETDCRIDAGYSEPRNLSVPIREPIGATDGRYLLCVLGDSQQPRHATFAHTAVDTVPPAITPRWSVRGDAEAYSVQFNFLVPDLSDYRYKFGPDAATDCDNPDGYLIYRRVPIRVPANTAPLVRFCVLGGDRNGNFTRPTHILLGQNQPLPGGAVNSAGFEPGPTSPNSWLSIFFTTETAETLGPITLRDAAGTEHLLINRRAAGNQINFTVPRNVALGPAEIRIPSPLPSTLLLDIQPISPGIFVSPNRAAWGFYQTPTRGQTFGACSGPSNCIQNPVPVPATVNPMVNGLGPGVARPIAIWLAGQRIPGLVTQFGSVSFDIPADFPYRGYVSLQLDIDGIRSNVAYLHLQDDGV